MLNEGKHLYISLLFTLRCFAKRNMTLICIEHCGRQRLTPLRESPER